MHQETDFKTYVNYWQGHANRVGPERAVTRMNPAQYKAHYLNVLTALVDRTPLTIIDLACGPGLIVPAVLEIWPDVAYLGMDPGPVMILEAQERYQNQYPQVSFIQMLEADMAGRKCDLLICHSLFTHIYEKDARRYLDQIRHAIGPDGIATISIHTNCDEGMRGSIGRIDYAPAYFEQMLSEHGLRIAQTMITNVQTYLAVRHA